MQDCRDCLQRRCQGGKHANQVAQRRREAYAVFAHTVRPLVGGNRRIDADNVDHDQAGCHKCRDQPLSCPQQAQARNQ